MRDKDKIFVFHFFRFTINTQAKIPGKHHLETLLFLKTRMMNKIDDCISIVLFVLT